MVQNIIQLDKPDIIPSLTPEMIVPDLALPGQWSKDKAWAWHNAQPYRYGANFIPADACNQLEMWLDPHNNPGASYGFNPEQIEQDMQLMQSIGMNTARTFLHDMAYQQDPAQFKQNMDTYLGIADRYGVQTMFVFFDSCWNPEPQLGHCAPTADMHNGGWVQSPGRDTLRREAEQMRTDPSYDGGLRAYVEDVTRTFARDKRVVVWDAYNEPDNLNVCSYNDSDAKWHDVETLLPQTFAWIRSQQPDQPVTSAVWVNYRQPYEQLHTIFQQQLTQSDVTTFHGYDPLDVYRQNALHVLAATGRPAWCTECVGRPGNNYDEVLPFGLQNNIPIIGWGVRNGRTQTHLNWGNNCDGTSFHDVFDANGAFVCKRDQALFATFPQQVAHANAARLSVAMAA